MFKKLALRYIRNHMSHETEAERNEIFKAITDGMRREFYEDNVFTRLSTATRWLVANDSGFKTDYAVPIASAIAVEMMEIQMSWSRRPRGKKDK